MARFLLDIGTTKTDLTKVTRTDSLAVEWKAKPTPLQSAK